MALITLGTNANNTLNALAWNPQSAIADIASIAANIKDDLNPAHPLVPGAFGQKGLLFIPNRRGSILLLPGDYIAYTSTGWPIVVSAAAVAADFTHS